MVSKQHSLAILHYLLSLYLLTSIEQIFFVSCATGSRIAVQLTLLLGSVHFVVWIMLEAKPGTREHLSWRALQQ